METNTNNSEKYLQAKKQVGKIKGFYRNLTAYGIVILSLAIINLNTYSGYLWFLWPLFWWGIGLVFHGMHVYNYMPFLGANWEEKKINELMEDEKKSKQQESWK
jgi:hypothetical protein